MDSKVPVAIAKTVKLRRRRFIFILPCFTLFTLFIGLLRYHGSVTESNNSRDIGRRLLQDAKANDTEFCIEPSINSFPGDFFTQEQRQKGGVAVHFIILIYMCAMLTIVCDEYFVPSLDIISQRMKLPSDIAGATFMAVGTSSPELFSSIIGSFITEGDIGIGTIVGSAVFNLLCVTGLAGIILWSTEVNVDWYPVTRDACVYTITVAALTLVISNNIVSWWEALILLVMYGIYIIIMYYNATIERFSLKQAKTFRDFWFRNSRKKKNVDEKTPLLSGKTVPSPEIESPMVEGDPSKDSYSIEFPRTEQKIPDKGAEALESLPDEDESKDVSLCSPPSCGTWQMVWWLLMWPASLLFYVTIPDCRKEKLEKFFVVTFVMSVIWLGILSYISVWMVTIIGYTFYIPDTVSGLTLLAAGTSLPEILSSLIVVKSGLGNMVMSNLIGSNIFDILFCLGAPWFIKTLSSDDGYLVINSSALTYTTTTLLATVVGILVIFNLSSWKLNRSMGFVCLIIYLIFVVLACMYELNIFGDFNPPTC